jgi:hypothetical protein
MLTIQLEFSRKAQKLYGFNWVLMLSISGLAPQQVRPGPVRATNGYSKSALKSDDDLMLNLAKEGKATIIAVNSSLPITITYAIINVTNSSAVKIGKSVLLRRYLSADVSKDLSIPAFSSGQVEAFMLKGANNGGSDSTPSSASAVSLNIAVVASAIALACAHATLW